MDERVLGHFYALSRLNYALKGGWTITGIAKKVQK